MNKPPQTRGHRHGIATYAHSLKSTSPKPEATNHLTADLKLETYCGSFPKAIQGMGLIGDVLYLVKDRLGTDFRTPGGTLLHVIDTPHLSLELIDVSGKLRAATDVGLLLFPLERRLPELTALIRRLEKKLFDRADRDGFGSKGGV